MILTASLSSDTIATLLLCGHFGDRRAGDRPLTPAEFHNLAHWLAGRRLGPGDLIGDSGLILRGLNDSALPPERLKTLLGRDDQLARALDTWLSEGIWVISERDADYPRRLSERLKSAGSPLLFGAGPRELLGRGGLCVVGSRDSPEAGRRFARSLGAKCGAQGVTLVSGYMRGINRDSVTAALEAGGTALFVLSDSLEKAIAVKRNREAAERGSLAFVTPFSPDTRFTVANAMRSNKYQYALADLAVIVETRRHGGVWSGADENRNEGWVPGFVRMGEDASPGNTALLHLGLRPITQEDVERCADIRECFLSTPPAPDGGDRADASGAGQMSDLYSIFLAELGNFAADPRSETDIMAHFDLERGQARKWLAHAVEDGRLNKSGRPARYLIPHD